MMIKHKQIQHLLIIILFFIFTGCCNFNQSRAYNLQKSINEYTIGCKNGEMRSKVKTTLGGLSGLLNIHSTTRGIIYVLFFETEQVEDYHLLEIRNYIEVHYDIKFPENNDSLVYQTRNKMEFWSYSRRTKSYDETINYELIRSFDFKKNRKLIRFQITTDKSFFLP